ncbi:unnamed protein product [Camellia sinensis]
MQKKKKKKKKTIRPIITPPPHAVRFLCVLIWEMNKERPPEPLDFFIWTVEEFEDDPHLYVLKPTNDFVSLGCPNSPLYAKPIAEAPEIEETDMSSQIHSNASDVKVGTL